MYNQTSSEEERKFPISGGKEGELKRTGLPRSSKSRRFRKHNVTSFQKVRENRKTKVRIERGRSRKKGARVNMKNRVTKRLT